MSNTFLLNLMRMTYELAQAERAFAVDSGLTVLGTIGMQADEIEASYLRNVQKALQESSPMITDNYSMSIDPTKAPLTNQSFPKLRFVLILPIAGYGAICMDQSLKHGVTSKEQVDRLNSFIETVIRDQQTELSEEELADLYEAM